MIWQFVIFVYVLPSESVTDVRSSAEPGVQKTQATIRFPAATFEPNVAAIVVPPAALNAPFS